MGKLTVLSKFRANKIYFFPLKTEWINFIEDETLLEKIDAIAVEDKGQVGIEFLKRYGVHPSENKAIQDLFDAREKADKDYLEQIKAVGQKTGLSYAEVEGILLNDGSIRETIEQAMLDAVGKVKSESAEQSLEMAKVVQDSILGNRKKTREYTKEAIDLVEPYLAELNKLFNERSNSYEAYNKGLIANFLGSPRRVVRLKDKQPIEFTSEDIDNLHPRMIVSLYQDYIYSDITQWKEPEETKEDESEPESEDDQKKE